jgi:hypothetical protein
LSENQERATGGQNSISVGAILYTWSNDLWANGLQADLREVMGKLTIQIWNSVYEITIIEGRSGEILLRGGQFFTELTPARLGGRQSVAASARCAGSTSASGWRSTPMTNAS